MKIKKEEIPVAFVTKNMKFLDFSPEKELDVVLNHIAKKMEEMSK